MVLLLPPTIKATVNNSSKVTIRLNSRATVLHPQLLNTTILMPNTTNLDMGNHNSKANTAHQQLEASNMAKHHIKTQTSNMDTNKTSGEAPIHQLLLRTSTHSPDPTIKPHMIQTIPTRTTTKHLEAPRKEIEV